MMIINAIKSILALLVGLVIAFVVDLFPALWRVLVFIALFFWRLLLAMFQLGDGEKPATAAQPSCVPIKHPSFKRPDPMIYDQYYLMGLGLAVSWQNPDITILKGGVPVASAYDLAPATTYTIRATIYNQSTDGVVYNMPVEFSYLSFGTGTQSHVIPGPAPLVSLGVKGSPQGIATVEKDWTTPAVPGHYCVQVSFACTDDANPFNNLGQENTQVVTAASPAEFTFTLRNPKDTRAEFHFEVDTFAILAPPVCGPRGKAGGPTNVVSSATSARNSRAANPLPSDWTIAFTPARPVLAALEEVTITGVVNPPNTFHGSLPVNVHTFSGNALIGGVTIVVNRA